MQILEDKRPFHHFFQGNQLTELDDQILSFIVKIWLEEEEPISKPSWQGTITHVPSGKRKSIHNIHGIEKFIQSFIESTPLHSDNSHPTT